MCASDNLIGKTSTTTPQLCEIKNYKKLVELKILFTKTSRIIAKSEHTALQHHERQRGRSE
jgi:hypothetical protein